MTRLASVEHFLQPLHQRYQHEPEYMQAVREVLDGGMPTPRASISPASRSRQPAERYGLTVAQARVTELLVTGCSNREIATKLGLSEGTVKVHVTAIYRALGVSRRSQALVLLSRRNKGL